LATFSLDKLFIEIIEFTPTTTATTIIVSKESTINFPFMDKRLSTTTSLSREATIVRLFYLLNGLNVKPVFTYKGSF
jgi:hypothetical protein